MSGPGEEFPPTPSLASSPELWAALEGSLPRALMAISAH